MSKKRIRGVFLFAVFVCIAHFYPARVSALPDNIELQQAKASIVIDVASGRVLESSNADMRLPMASTTKIMTALVAIEKGDLGSMVTVGKNAEGISGSSLYLQEGDEISLGDLIVATMFVSGNDGTVAIAEHVAGSFEDFVEMMNKKAVQLGCLDTHFRNPHGLSEPDHYTTAADLAKITAYALQNETFLRIVSSRDYPVTLNGTTVIMVNKDQFLHRYAFALGVKTGTTDAAGRCFVSAAEKDGLLLCGVVLNSSDIYGESQAMMERNFSSYIVKTAGVRGDYLATIPVEGGIEEYYRVVLPKTISVPVRKDGSETAAFDFAMADRLEAPVNYRDKIGVITVKVGDEVIWTEDILAEYSIHRKGWTAGMLYKQFCDIMEMLF